MQKGGSMRFVRPLLFVAAVAILAEGCAFSRGTLGDDIKTEAVASIKKGATTKIEVITLLGAPDRVLQVNGRDVFQYYRYDAKAGSLLLILINFSRLSIKSDDLFVMVNQNGIVEDVISSKRTDSLEFRFWPFGD
jgi:outer membrane protein assembly factor BamE (lipoprotein component of BamABCDE complex)